MKSTNKKEPAGDDSNRDHVVSSEKKSKIMEGLRPNQRWQKASVLVGIVFVAVVGTYATFASFADTTTYIKTWNTAAAWGTNSTLNNAVVKAGVSSDTLSLMPQASSNVVVSPNTTDLALNRPTVATSSQNSGTGQALPASNATDGNGATRWSSAYSDAQSIYVDLGSTYNITGVQLIWEAAYGKAYQIQVSNDAKTWTTVRTVTNGGGGTDNLSNLSGVGRYVRMYGTARGTQWGYSLYSFVVHGSAATNLALNHTATASSEQNSGTNVALPASNATDASTTTRWSSAYSDPQWIYVDLGSSFNISDVQLQWETAYGKNYQIQVSNDAKTWTTIKTVSGGTGGVNNFNGLTGSGRYVRMYGTARGTQWGYSLYDLLVYGTPTATTPTTTYATSGGITILFDADAGTSSTAAVDWTSASISDSLPTGTSIYTQFATSTDNATWSGWETDVTKLANSRYIKIQLKLSTTNPQVTPVVNSFSLGYTGGSAAPTPPPVSTTDPGLPAADNGADGWTTKVNDTFDAGGVPSHWNVYTGKYSGNGANCTSSSHVIVSSGMLTLLMKYDNSGTNASATCTGNQWYTGAISGGVSAVSKRVTMRWRIVNGGAVQARVMPEDWPDDGSVWPNGEHDYCEGDSSTSCGFFMHYGSTSNKQQVVGPSIPEDLTQWHITRSVRDGQTFQEFIDNLVTPVWSQTLTTTQAPAISDHTVLQQECDYHGCPTTTTGTAEIQVDWVQIDTK